MATTSTAGRVARTVPTFSWSSPTQWTIRPKPALLLVLGLSLFGVGDWLLIASRLGNSPWSVLAGGVDRHTHIGIGTVTVITAIVVLLLWIPLKQRPGLGTVANAVIIGTVVELLERTVPPVDSLLVRMAMMVLGLLTVGAGGALYLSTRFGPGPRDGLMTGIATRTGRPIAHVRLAIELTVMALGVLLGGRLGVGTVVFALTIGHALALFVALLHRLDLR